MTKRPLFPRRPMPTDQLPVVGTLDTSSPRAAQLKKLEPPAPASDATANEAQFNALHARLDTLEALIREAFVELRKQVNDLERRVTALEQERKKGKRP